MGLYKPNGIPWGGKSAVVPMKAVEDMRKLNHNWNWIPLEDIERTCHLVRHESNKSHGWWTCSECGARVNGSKCNPANYCSNCGARVKEEPDAD